MNRIVFVLLLFPVLLIGQNESDSSDVVIHHVPSFKKRVLDNIELNILSSIYTQRGLNAAVTGGVGSEKLNDYATNISVAIPISDDRALSIDGTISAYTSASSFNTNPFNRSGEDDEFDEEEEDFVNGSPWIEYSGASLSDVWYNFVIGYRYSSDDRNTITKSNISFAYEYDYISGGFGAGLTKLYNQKNTELNIDANIFIDNWLPVYPVELAANNKIQGNLNEGFFRDLDIIDKNGNAINKNDPNNWNPNSETLIDKSGRYTFSLSLGFSQILNMRSQFTILFDPTVQLGWLANPMNRIYFSDRDNFYIGNPLSIDNYTNSSNKDVFQLADDIERLPRSRLKLPVGVRLNYYLNDYFVLNTYYRYYHDNWGISSNTINIDLPIKLNNKYTLYPSFRYYNQTAADYFAPYEAHLSTKQYYTSDYDLSKFEAIQYGLGMTYSDIFLTDHIWKFGLKQLSVNYNFYKRNTGLKAHIVSIGAKFELGK